MHMVRTRPFSLARDLDAFFSSTLPASSAARAWSPRVDIYEADGALTLRFELAGFSAEDLEVTLEDGYLKVAGSRSFESPEGAEYHRNELARGSFSRTLRVSDAYDAEAVTAAYANGILEVSLEKRPEVLPRAIEITTN